MDKYKTTDVGGLPFTLNDFRQFLGRLAAPTQGIYQAFNNLLRGFGDNFIVQGCVLSGSTGSFSITEGWIILSGELIKVDAQGPFNEAVNGTFTKVTTFDSRGTKTFLNGSINETYETNRGVIVGLAGTLDFDGDNIEEIVGLTEWATIPHVGGDFEVNTQGGGDNWDFDVPGDDIVMRFRKRGKTVDVQMDLDTFAVTVATSVQSLIISNLPFTAKVNSIGSAAFFDITANTSFPGKVKMLLGENKIRISQTIGTGEDPDISASTNMKVQLSITLEIE